MIPLISRVSKLTENLYIYIYIYIYPFNPDFFTLSFTKPIEILPKHKEYTVILVCFVLNW